MTHDNSIAALKNTGQSRSNLETRILELMADQQPRTGRQIATDLNYFEPLRPRVTELIASGQLHEVGDTVCPVTGKTVRLTRRFL